MQTRRAQVEKVIAENRASYDAFDSGSLGDATLEMIPFVVFRVLQELEPAAFGNAALESNGFYERSDSPTGHNGIVWTKPTSPDGAFPLRYMTRTCSSCHTGRYDWRTDSMWLMHGGANTEINLHRFIGTLTATLQTNLSPSNDTPAYQAFRKRILDALASKPADWSWGANGNVSPADATTEVAIVTKNIDAVLTRMRMMNERRPGRTGAAPGAQLQPGAECAESARRRAWPCRNLRSRQRPRSFRSWGWTRRPPCCRPGRRRRTFRPCG